MIFLTVCWIQTIIYQGQPFWKSLIYFLLYKEIYVKLFYWRRLSPKRYYLLVKIASRNTIQHKVSTIIIGDIKDIKQGSNLKSFVQIPIQRLVELIEYKAELEGIQIVKINESYTSGCSAIDLEKLHKFNYNKSRRIKRGLFKTNEDILINSDQNGSLNILRKYLKEKCILRPVKQARDNGFVDNPERIRIA